MHLCNIGFHTLCYALTLFGGLKRKVMQKLTLAVCGECGHGSQRAPPFGLGSSCMYIKCTFLIQFQKHHKCTYTHTLGIRYRDEWTEFRFGLQKCVRVCSIWLRGWELQKVVCVCVCTRRQLDIPPDSAELFKAAQLSGRGVCMCVCLPCLAIITCSCLWRSVALHWIETAAYLMIWKRVWDYEMEECRITLWHLGCYLWCV